MTDLFPMMGGPSIPWELAKAVYDELYVPLFGDEQSLEAIAQRGGFYWSELKQFTDLRKAQSDNIEKTLAMMRELRCLCGGRPAYANAPLCPRCRMIQWLEKLD